MTSLKEVREALKPCPFCGTADPFRGDHRAQPSDRDPRNGRTITCRESTCQAYMFRAQCWHDEEHTRLDTVEEMDAALAARWNRRALYDSLLTEEAEANVSEIRSWDAPGFDACVKAERERLAQMEDRAGDYKAQAVIDPKPKSLLEMVEEQSARPVPPFGYHPLPDDAAASPSPSALTEEGVTDGMDSERGIVGTDRPRR